MFWSFGACCLVQSLLFLGLVVVVAKPGGSVQEVLLAYAASHGVAALLAACLSGARMTVRPRFGLLRSAWTVGAPVTLGNIAESGLYLGARYLLAAFGSRSSSGFSPSASIWLNGLWDFRSISRASSSCLRHFATPPMAIPANFAACC